MGDAIRHDQVADLIYNGVMIHNCQTEQFTQETFYENTGSDQIGNHYRIVVVGYVFPKYDANAYNILGVYNFNPPSGQAIPVTTQGDCVASMVAIRNLLLAPRGYFKYTVAGQTLLETTPERQSSNYRINNIPADIDYSKLDIKNGPHPISCNISKVFGGGLFRIRYEIETWTDGCKDALVLSNRWSLIESADSCQYVTRTIQGRIRFRSAICDAANDNQGNPQTRFGIFPGLAESFVRESIQTTRSADGLELDYTVTDRQIYAAAPAPAYEWTCVHREIAQDKDVAAVSVEVMMRGPPGPGNEMFKGKMLSAAMAVIEAKVGVVLAKASSSSGPNQRSLEVTLIHHMEFIDFVHDSQIQVNFVGQRESNWITGHTIDDLANAILGGGADEVIRSPIGKRLNAQGQVDEMQGEGGIGTDKYNPYHAVRVPNYPQGSLASDFICFLQNPCSDHRINDPTQRGKTTSPYAPPPDYLNAIQQGTELAQSGGTLTTRPISNTMYDSSKDADYAVYKIDSSYHTQQFTVHMPVSLDQSAGSSEATSVLGTLAPPITKRQVIIEGRRTRKRPVLLRHEKYEDPDMGTCVPFGTATINHLTPTLSVDGLTFVYSVHAEYWWACEKAFNSSARGTAIPWIKGDAGDEAHKIKLSEPDDDAFTHPGKGRVG